jgi:hypothetical protein
VAEQLRLAVLGAYDGLFGLELEHLAMDGCTTKAPCGGQTAGPGGRSDARPCPGRDHEAGLMQIEAELIKK